MPDLPAEAVMSPVPKVVGVRQNTKDGLWKECGEKLRGRFLAKSWKAMLAKPGRARRAKAHSTSTARLLRAFREEDEAS